MGQVNSKENMEGLSAHLTGATGGARAVRNCALERSVSQWRRSRQKSAHEMKRSERELQPAGNFSHRLWRSSKTSRDSVQALPFQDEQPHLLDFVMAPWRSKLLLVGLQGRHCLAPFQAVERAFAEGAAQQISVAQLLAAASLLFAPAAQEVLSHYSRCSRTALREGSYRNKAVRNLITVKLQDGRRRR